MKGLMEKIKEYSNLVGEPIFICKTDKGFFCGKSTVGDDGVVLFTKESGFGPITKKVIIRSDDERLDNDLVRKLIENRRFVEKRYKEVIKEKEAMEEKLKQFILIDRQMKELVNKVVLEELFIDKYSTLSEVFKESLEDKIDWNFIRNELNIECHNDTVFISNKRVSLEVKLKVPHWTPETEIENIRINIKDLDVSETCLEEIFKAIENKNLKMSRSFPTQKMCELVGWYFSIIPTIEHFFKVNKSCLNEIKEMRNVSELPFNRRKYEANIDHMKLIDDVDFITLFLYSGPNVFKITTDPDFKKIKQEVWKMTIEEDLYYKSEIYALKTKGDFRHGRELQTLKSAISFLKSFDAYILDLAVLSVKENMMKNALKESKNPIESFIQR